MCIAGVFGGIDSGVKAETVNVFVESAYFDPGSIRKTSKRHTLQTDASFRYERGADPGINEYAAAICQFVSSRQAWENHEYAKGTCHRNMPMGTGLQDQKMTLAPLLSP